MKMEDRFALPVNGDDVLCFAHKEDCDAAAHAINCHDDLLAALKEAEKELSALGAVTVTARVKAAIAKAEGR